MQNEVVVEMADPRSSLLMQIVDLVEFRIETSGGGFAVIADIVAHYVFV